MAHSMDHSVLQATLPPPVSISRSGRRAHEQLHTVALIKTGMESLKPRKKAGNLTIKPNEVIHPSQLDDFGTAPAGIDHGRHREMVSSPRLHPLLVARAELLEKTTKGNVFERRIRELNLLKGTSSSNSNVTSSSLPSTSFRFFGGGASGMSATSRGGAPAGGPSTTTTASATDPHHHPNIAIAVSSAGAGPDLAEKMLSAASGVLVPPHNATHPAVDGDAVSSSASGLPIVAKSSAGPQPPPGSPTKPTTAGGSWGFKTAPRFERPFSRPAAPPVGHYRPKFTVVDSRSPCAHILSPRKQKKKLLLTRDGTQMGGGPGPGGTSPTASNASASGHPSAENKTKGSVMIASEADPTHAEIGGSSFYPNMTLNIPGGDDNAPTPAAPTTPGKRVPTRGSPAFLSRTLGVAERPPEPLRSPDKYYFPYNEILVLERSGKGAMIDFSKELPRELAAKRLNPPDGPDIVYDIKIPYKGPKADLFFHKQVSRAQLQQAQMRKLPPATVAAIYPAPPEGCLSTDRRMDVCTALFGRASGRTVAPSVLRGRQRLGSMDLGQHQLPNVIRDYERINARHTPAFKFDQQTSRRPLYDTLPIDAIYDVNVDIKYPSSPTARLDDGHGHHAQFAVPCTANLDYNPNDHIMVPFNNPGIIFNKAQARSTPPKVLDKFYDTDTPLLQQRVKGDPMLHNHVGREKREAMSPKPQGPDKYYDYDIDKFLPVPPPGVLDFGKVTGREGKSGGKANTTPRGGGGSPNRRGPGGPSVSLDDD